MSNSPESIGYETAIHATRVFISNAFKAGDNLDNMRAAGDVLPRTCIVRMGITSCKDCVYYEQYPIEAAELKVCSERNLVNILGEQELAPEEVLLVSVTANGVGFYDSLDSEEVTENEFGNYEQVKGYNAFFARASEKKALGARLADCGHVAIEFDLPDGDVGFGFIHITRNNMEGVGAETQGEDSEKLNYVAYALKSASEHYGVPVAEMRVKLTAAINHLFYTFSSKEGESTPEQKMDKLFAGWFDMGLLHNENQPEWKRGDPINPTDNWHADYHEMCKYLLKTSGVKPENIDLSRILEPMDIESGHASNVAGFYGSRPEARDLYLVIAK